MTRGGPRNGKPWTADEDSLIRAHYSETPRRELQQLFPGRSHSAITSRARVLGVKKCPKVRYRSQAEAMQERWSRLKQGPERAQSLLRQVASILKCREEDIPLKVLELRSRAWGPR